jgi:tetratricopeptide (TPR) repeat protein
VKKKKNKKHKLPRNFRFITELVKELEGKNLFHQKLLIIFVVCCFLAAFLAISLDLWANLVEKRRIDQERVVLVEELKYWNDFLDKYEIYPDAYIKTSILQYKLGDVMSAKELVEKALSLNPNSEKGIKLKEFLEENK